MRKILSSRIFRILVCFVLICCFLVNLSPIKAEAMALPEVGAAVTASKVIYLTSPLGVQIFGWVLLGLGITLLAIDTVTLVNDFQQYSDMLEVSIYYYPDGSWSYGVDMGFVDQVRAFLFDSGYLICTGPADNLDIYDFPIGSSWPNALESCITRGDSAVLFKQNCGSFYRCYLLNCSTGTISVSISSNGSYMVTCSAGSMEYRCEPDSASTFNPRTVSNAYIPAENTIYWYVSGDVITENNISAADGLELGTVAPPDVDIPNGYPEWYANSQPAVLPDSDEKIQVLPIPLNPDSESEGLPDGATQPDAWAGSNADPLPDMDTDSDSGTGSWTPPSDMGKFTLDLKQYFPFCIPFDLYAFFTCLNAEPVAPVIEWIIPLPGGKTYPFEIDLSAFDSVAQILHRMQLLLFCVGLAFKTRDLIKG